ncbi:hypothetical protein BV20DRAFT_954980 [Pilatotrama ljubarskyi]|nr:hypothetical protein BV20DRAFT_954980 [Pilatotrama ljubarskyi]
MSDSDYAQEIIGAYPRLLAENYCIIASSVWLWFDFTLTCSAEYQRIWRRKYTGATVVYLLTRYIAMIERVFFVLEVLIWNSSDQVRTPPCGGITHTDDVLLLLNYLAFTAFTTLRVYGVWGRDWKPPLIVLPLSLVRPILLMYENTNYVPVQAGPPFGCVYIFSLSDKILSKYVLSLCRYFSITTKATTLAADAILVILTWIKTFGIVRASLQTGMRTPLATLLLRDGTAYFLVLLVIQLITIVSNEVGTSVKLTIWLVWPYFEQAIIVIFHSRFMLDLRGLYFAESGDRDTTTSLHFSDVKFQGFTSDVVGNFGATLSTTLGLPMRSGTGDTPSPATSSEAFDRESRDDWDDDLCEYCVDPFKTGLDASDPGKPPALVGEVGEVEDVEEQPVTDLYVSVDHMRASALDG